MSEQGVFTRFSNAVSTWTAKPVTFVGATAFIVAWAVTGPLFQFSETWQLVINTSTTIITFLMVFILQNSQNRDGRAIQAKLDELILTSKAENEFIGVENLDEEKIRDLIELLEARLRRKRIRKTQTRGRQANPPDARARPLIVSIAPDRCTMAASPADVQGVDD